jgi:hypothetical protein
MKSLKKFTAQVESLLLGLLNEDPNHRMAFAALSSHPSLKEFPWGEVEKMKKISPFRKFEWDDGKIVNDEFSNEFSDSSSESSSSDSCSSDSSEEEEEEGGNITIASRSNGPQGVSLGQPKIKIKAGVHSPRPNFANEEEAVEYCKSKMLKIGEDQYKCTLEECGGEKNVKTLAKKSAYQHYKRHAQNFAKTFVCANLKCSKSFATKERLADHARKCKNC